MFRDRVEIRDVIPNLLLVPKALPEKNDSARNQKIKISTYKS